MNQPHLSPKSRSPASPPAQVSLIGVFVLAFGIACLLGVGTLAYLKFHNTGTHARPPAQGGAAGDRTPDAPGLSALQGASNLEKPPLSALTGAWKAEIGGRAATLVIARDAFRIIYSADENGRLRKYSSGHYRYDEKTARLRLMPRRDFAVPKPLPGVTYKILTARYFDVTVLKEKNGAALLWVPPEEKLKSRLVHPLFLYNGGPEIPVVKWNRTK